MRAFYKVSVANGFILTDDQIRSLAILLDDDAWTEPFEDSDYINVHDCFDELSAVPVLSDKVRITLASNEYNDISESAIVLYYPSTLREFKFLETKESVAVLGENLPMWDEQEALDKICEMTGINAYPRQIIWSNIS